MSLRTDVAKAMYETPIYGEEEGGTWPPAHPDDLEAWLAYADSAIEVVLDALEIP